MPREDAGQDGEVTEAERADMSDLSTMDVDEPGNEGGQEDDDE
ncbi:hypothetical protein [Streptomyces sp. NPDC007100]